MKGRKLLFLFFIVVISLLMLSIKSVDSREVHIDSDGNIWVDGKLDEKAKTYQIFDSSLNNITPNYQIILIVDKRTINGGEEFIISFQISGNGRVVSNKLLTYFPTEFLKEDPAYYIYIGESIDENTHKITGTVWFDKYPEIKIGNKEGSFISFVNATFKQVYPDHTMIFGEKTINHHRPVYIKAISSNNASAGDHIIKVQFLYSDGESWYNSQDEVTIHIREWYELLWVQIGILIIIGLILFFIDIGIRKYPLRKG